MELAIDPFNMYVPLQKLILILADFRHGLLKLH